MVSDIISDIFSINVSDITSFNCSRIGEKVSVFSIISTNTVSAALEIVVCASWDNSIPATVLGLTTSTPKPLTSGSDNSTLHCTIIPEMSTSYIFG